MKYAKLRGKIVEKGFKNLKVFAKAINLSSVSLSQKLNDKVEHGFTQSDIKNICSILDIKTKDIGEYFFAEEV